MNKKPIYNHDREGDILYISFSPGEKVKTAVGLTDDILLRFNRAERRAIGITILNYSDMIKHIEKIRSNYNIPLNGLYDLEPDWQEDVIETLKCPPANYEVEFFDDKVIFLPKKYAFKGSMRQIKNMSIRFRHFDSFLVNKKPQRIAA